MRAQFLDQQWRRYPALPEGIAMSWARIRHFQSGGIQTDMGGRLNFADRVHLGPTVSSQAAVSRAQLEVVLRPGDWIAWETANARQPLSELWLLAPCLTGAAPRPRVGRETLEAWADLQAGIRQFFKSQGFLEAQTPTLVIGPGTEPSLEPFRTQWKVGQRNFPLTLPTSPEIHLKKMLAMNMGPLFELKTCFRNGEVTELHEPEFTMLEWYRPGAPLTKIADDAVQLVKQMSNAEDVPVVHTTMKDLFAQHLGVTITPESTHEEWLQIAKTAKIDVHASDSTSDLFHRLWLEKIESQWDSETLWVVSDFPPFQAAYARIKSDGWAERFEIYWRGLELCNAFHEVNDPVLQKQRMIQDLQIKKELGRETVELDEEFLRALESGMPPSSGIALGVDRLFMAINHVPTIQNLRLFPSERWLSSEA